MEEPVAFSNLFPGFIVVCKFPTPYVFPGILREKKKSSSVMKSFRNSELKTFSSHNRKKSKLSMFLVYFLKVSALCFSGYFPTKWSLPYFFLVSSVPKNSKYPKLCACYKGFFRTLNSLCFWCPPSVLETQTAKTASLERERVRIPSTRSRTRK